MEDELRARCQSSVCPHRRCAVRHVLVASFAAIRQRVRVYRYGPNPFQLQRKLTRRVNAPGRQRLHHCQHSRSTRVQHPLRRERDRLREGRRNRLAILQVARIDASPESQLNLRMRCNRGAGLIVRPNGARLRRRISDRRARRWLNRAGLCRGVSHRLALRLLRHRSKAHTQHRRGRQPPHSGEAEYHPSHHAQLSRGSQPAHCLGRIQPPPCCIIRTV